MELKGTVALVLGAIKGIGKGIALSLADAGVKAVLNYFDWEEELAVLEKDLDDIGQEHLILKTDLLETAAIPRMIQNVIDRFGRLDILINNIERGGWPVVHGPYVEKQWDLEMETTAIVGRTGPASLIFNDGYAAANKGVSLLTETWARIGAPEVRVNEIMLGFFETRHAEETRGWDLLSATHKKALKAHTLLGRTGTIEDVVKAVRYIIKDAEFMTGSVLRLDGGYVLGGEKVDKIPEGAL
jgi:3-oxoacyl-[acyl-carrier protein] reductase